ncbi:hypothetical protein GH714_039465 [Hevea brasiliensis]|uniref:Bulb-type lectin domain-containing protein n=1 Tax=Hevea brasiliensis TaxID=3981 RepID=A0A6A6MV31_HEVBR|nr:hypothetical protein GH714_039465 [Hevea brasiliensis]
MEDSMLPSPMAFALVPLSFSLLFLLPSFALAQNGGNLTRRSLLLAIWYDKIPDKTIVWYAHGDDPAPKNSKVELTDGGLVLTDPRRAELWRSGTTGAVTSGAMTDAGNFVLQDGLLSLGKASRILLIQYCLHKPWTGKGCFLLDIQIPIFPGEGYLYILRENRQKFTLGVEPPTGNFYHRATLNFDGVLLIIIAPKASTGNERWTPLWTKPINICQNSMVTAGSGICGFNSVCTLVQDQRPTCECPSGYSLFDPNDQYGGCKANFTQRCEESEMGPVEDLYGFEVLLNTDWPTSDYALLQPFTEDGCRQSCLQDCMCAVAIFRSGDMCWKKKLPLSNGR